MTTVKAFIRTKKKNIPVKVRFRLSDGRDIELFHKSEFKIVPEKWDNKLEKYKAKCIVNQKDRIVFDKNIADRKNLILDIYDKDKPKTSEQLENLIDRIINPQKYEVSPKNDFIEKFNKYIDDCLKNGVFSKGTKDQYQVLSRDINRFIIINKIEKYNITDFSSEYIVLFREFLRDEYKFVEKYPDLYSELKKNNVPQKMRSQNTIAIKLKKLQAFFNEQEKCDEIHVSPFRKLGKRKAVLLKEQYDAPFYLEKEEFQRILDNPCPEHLQETRDAFILQCSLGCRINDFCSLGYDNLSQFNGIPYIHYLPSKTSKEGEFRKEIQTPLMKFSLDIIKKYDFQFNIIRYVSGKGGYNKKIKELIQHYEINRLVGVFNEQLNQMEYVPLYQLASSKLARKTHVDIINKVQINKYAAGLHSSSSTAVDRYTYLSIKDRFILMCAAFDSEMYEVDENYNIVGQ